MRPKNISDKEEEVKSSSDQTSDSSQADNLTADGSSQNPSEETKEEEKSPEEKILELEAITWAYNRLNKRKEERKILMVISDGAPVDDSTLSVNSGDFLEKHLKKIVRFIENSSNIEILAIGIGHDVSRYYQKAIKITDVQELGDVMISQLSGLFDNKKKLH